MQFTDALVVKWKIILLLYIQGPFFIAKFLCKNDLMADIYPWDGKIAVKISKPSVYSSHLPM